MRTEQIDKNKKYIAKEKRSRPEPKFALDYIATQSDLREMKMELKGDIALLRAELKGDIAVLKTDIETIMSLGKLLLIVITIGFVALGLLIKL